MDQASEIKPEQTLTFTGSTDNRLIGDCYAPSGEQCGVVLLLHGGGQTRHSWGGTARSLARRGWRAVTADLRGHGDSDWLKGGEYAYDDYGGDAACLARAVHARYGARPVLIGASLGGIGAMLAVNTAEGGADLLSALVLVDITPTVKAEGVGRIMAFMAAHAEEGFASLDEAAGVISTYLPHREKPRDLSGLAKNLRRSSDGRYRWHWDPRFITQRQHMSGAAEDLSRDLKGAIAGIKIPCLLVRGGKSELVGQDDVDEFLKLSPHTSVTGVSGARHMVAGDRNDVFSDAVVEFLNAL